MTESAPPADLIKNAKALPADTTTVDVDALSELSRKLRIDILDMIFTAQSGHPGTSLSCIDLLVCLFGELMQHDAKRPDWADRDRFVLSKGHGAPALYAILMHHGYIGWEEKPTLRQVNSNLQGHPASKYVDGVDISTGSLGQGLSAAVGMALGLRLNNSPAHVYCLIGDGESQEGQIWEAALSAPAHKLTNLTALCDRNSLQIDGNTEAIKPLGDIGAKFEAFGWNVLRIDGHDFRQIIAAGHRAKAWSQETDKPTMIVCQCTKGKGVSFMENEAGWHGKAPNAEQYEAALADLQPDVYYQRLKEAN
ncbi:MAG: transketolase [Cyanobacteria bacterium HKST-UBA04]|nr:transketolase [Cyanobacteria bacterium HKST-UBA04]